MFSKEPVPGTRAMIARAHYLTTQAEVRILTQGDNVVDGLVLGW